MAKKDSIHKQYGYQTVLSRDPATIIRPLPVKNSGSIAGALKRNSGSIAGAFERNSGSIAGARNSGSMAGAVFGRSFVGIWFQHLYEKSRAIYN